MTSDAPLFSVIIPTFNRRELVLRAVASVLAQQDRDYELLVVDDGSTDGSTEALAQFGSQVKRLASPNRGPGPARNLGVESARGKYVAFLDSDDLWFPWTLTVYRQVIDTHGEPMCLLTQPRMFRMEDELKEIALQLPTVRVFEDYLTSAKTAIFRGTGVMCIERDAFVAAGGFFDMPIYNEDLDLLLRLGTRGRIAVIDSPPQVAVRIHSSSSLSDLQRTYDGTLFLLKQEQTGQYPGGPARRSDRCHLLAHQSQFLFWQCLKQPRPGLALRLFRRALPIYIALGQWRFMALAMRSLTMGFIVPPVKSALRLSGLRSGDGGKTREQARPPQQH